MKLWQHRDWTHAAAVAGAIWLGLRLGRVGRPLRRWAAGSWRGNG